MRSGEVPAPIIPLAKAAPTGKAPDRASGADPPPPHPGDGDRPPREIDEAKGNLRPGPEKSTAGDGDPPDSDDPSDDGDDGDDDDEEDDVSGRDLLKALKQLLKGNKKSSENNAKEADHIKVPPFPYPESYQDWKIKVRDAVRAASKTPDKAGKRALSLPTW